MCNNKRTPHKHAELIKAWADGAEIEVRSKYGNGWMKSGNPSWEPDYEYRIKPEPTDYEKYGVQIGDIWTTPVNGSYCITELHGLGFCAMSDCYSGFASVPFSVIKQNQGRLLFRKDVCNRLSEVAV